MAELFKTLKDFITRDILYIIGGFSVGTSFYFGYTGGNIETIFTFIEGMGAPAFLIAISFSHIIGYCIQETLCLTPIVTTARFKPGILTAFFYRAYTNKDWEISSNFDFLRTNIIHFNSLSEKQTNEYERVIFLKHIGVTIGTNWLVSSLILFFYAQNHCSLVLFKIGVFVFVFAIALIVHSWVKGAQQILYLEYFDQISKKTEKGKG